MSTPVHMAELDLATGAHRSSGARLRSYVVGLALAIILTAGSFWAASSNLVWAPSIPVLLAVLAIAQMGVHLVFFLHVNSAPDSAQHDLGARLWYFRGRTGRVRLHDHHDKLESRDVDGQADANAALGAQRRAARRGTSPRSASANNL